MHWLTPMQPLLLQDRATMVAGQAAIQTCSRASLSLLLPLYNVLLDTDFVVAYMLRTVRACVLTKRMLHLRCAGGSRCLS
eukprot:SAG31_NODE_22002_length_536_cov_0.649886_1_plen_79_part_01